MITFLGHVDHGKTSLLDSIIGIDVVSGESGGITQHIRAYQIEKDGRQISFVDTPGHEAFTEMRARGANVTDIAVLVVAADDGVMPQTEEAISHARAAGVPIVVALNKIDLPGVDINRIYQQLAANELLPSEWGGDVEVVKTSATTGTGMDELLDTLLTVAELHDYKANPSRPAPGHVPGSAAAWPTRRDGQAHRAERHAASGRRRRLRPGVRPRQEHVRHARRQAAVRRGRPQHAGEPVGLRRGPGGGRALLRARRHRPGPRDRRVARRERARHRARRPRPRARDAGEPVRPPGRHGRAGDAQHHPAGRRARLDRGDSEGARSSSTPRCKIKVLQATVGGITEADVHLADASDAIIIGFNVVPDEKARTLAEQRGVQIRRYDIIYKITDDLKLALEGMLKPEEREVDLGRALVQQVFRISRVGTIAGCRVLSGTIERNGRVRVIRDSTIIGDYAIDSLQREKDDAKEVREGLECGIKLVGLQRRQGRRPAGSVPRRGNRPHVRQVSRAPSNLTPGGSPGAK